MPIGYTIKCPKCGYTKQISDAFPLVVCPKCKVKMSANTSVVMDTINTIIRALKGKR